MFGHEGGCEDREKIAEDNEKSKKNVPILIHEKT